MILKVWSENIICGYEYGHVWSEYVYDIFRHERTVTEFKGFYGFRFDQNRELPLSGVWKGLCFSVLA